VISKEILADFVKEYLPNFEIQPVVGDGLCMLSSFTKALSSIHNETFTMSTVIDALRKEINSNNEFYNSFLESDMIIEEEIERYLESPLDFYDTNSSDLIITALRNAFKVNAIVFQSNYKRCWIIDLSDSNKRFQKTVFFGRSESKHLDPILPKIQSQSDDSDLEITTIVEGLKDNLQQLNEQRIEIIDDDDVIVADNTCSRAESFQQGNVFHLFRVYFISVIKNKLLLWNHLSVLCDFLPQFNNHNFISFR